MIVSLIAALASNNVIGAKGDLPWHLPRDLNFFSETTRGRHVIMGRKNYDSIPEKYRPLPRRPNLVVTRNTLFSAQGTYVFQSIETALEFAKSEGEKEAFIIGGGEIYKQSLPLADKMYLTHIEAEIAGDTYFPHFDRYEWNQKLILKQEVDAVHKFSFKTFEYTKK